MRSFCSCWPSSRTSTVRHGVEHHLSATGPPVHARPGHYSPLQQSVGFTPAYRTEAWGRGAPCGGYRRLNDATVPDRYPVPHIQDFSAHLSDSVPLLFVYLDDVLVASTSRAEHTSHLRMLFDRLSQHGLIIKPAKCQFGLSTIDFLGHRITKDGAIPLPSKVEAVTNVARPLTVKALQEFLGMINFYHRFIPRAAQLMRPLDEALKDKASKKMVDGTEERERAFVDAKCLWRRQQCWHTRPLKLRFPSPQTLRTTRWAPCTSSG